MNTTTIIMVALAVILTVVAYFRDGVHLAGLRLGAQTIWDNLPLLLASFAVAGLARVLIPKELRLSGSSQGTSHILGVWYNQRKLAEVMPC
jgi:uncharacterized membrane protein